jgi:hypothetical protein
VVPQGDLYHKKVSLSLLRILHYPKIDILIAEYFALYRLSKPIQLSGITGLLHRLSRLVDLGSVKVVNILCHSNIYIFGGAVTAVIASILVNLFVGLVVRVKEVINVELKAIVSVAIIVIIKAIINVVLSVIIFASALLSLFSLIYFFCFAKGVLTSFTLRRVNKLCWAATYIG